jgi:TM2 domain-containing membrane protein YozV
MTETADNRVTLYPDGKYRWVYEVPMLKNPSILRDVYKVLGISFGLVWLFNVLIIGCEEGYALEGLWGITSGFLVLMGVFLVIGFIAYVIVAWCYGWKYVVLFTLDERQVVHEQMPRQVKKAMLLGALTAMVGGAAGKPGVVGTGLLAASRNSTTSVFADVARLKPCRRHNLIKVNQLLNKNRIFVPDEDFDFVYNFLCQHCPKASIKGAGF